MTEQLKYWHNHAIQRYTLAIFKYKDRAKDKSVIIYPKAYLNHPVFWHGLRKIVLHSTSSKLLQNRSLYGSFSLAFSCIGGQTPSLIKSKQSVAAFKMLKGSPMGNTSHLRSQRLYKFSYKWTFLAASAGQNLVGNNLKTNSVGLTNVFVFPELDQLDYYAFEPLPGFEIGFDHNHRIFTALAQH